MTINTRVKSCCTSIFMSYSRSHQNIFPDAESISNSNYLGKREQVSPKARVKTVQMWPFMCRWSAAGKREGILKRAAVQARYCAWISCTACKLCSLLNFSCQKVCFYVEKVITIHFPGVKTSNLSTLAISLQQQRCSIRCLCKSEDLMWMYKEDEGEEKRHEYKTATNNPLCLLLITTLPFYNVCMCFVFIFFFKVPPCQCYHAL